MDRFRRSRAHGLVRLPMACVLAVVSLGVFATSAFAGTEVYVEGEHTPACTSACKSTVHDMVRTQSEGRTSGVTWCMNSYLGSGGETDPGFGNHCQGPGKETQHYAGEYPPNQATSQTWVKANGWIWGWAEWG